MAFDGYTLGELTSKLDRRLRNYGKFQWQATEATDLINEGYIDFVNRTKCLRTNSYIELAADTPTYTLETDILQLRSALYRGKSLSLMTNDSMDRIFGTNWRETTSTTIDYLIQDNLGHASTRIYPFFTDLDNATITIDDNHCLLNFTYDSTAGEITLTNGDYDGDDLATEIATQIDTEYSITSTVAFDSATGVITITVAANDISFTYSGSTAGDRIGFRADISADTSIYGVSAIYIDYNYTYLPDELSATSSKPVLPYRYHIALFYYALYSLLLDAVGEGQDKMGAAHAWEQYMKLVEDCRNFVELGYQRSRDSQVIPRPFV